MTREDIAAYGEKHYGKRFITKLAADMGYSVAAVSRAVSGESADESAILEKVNE